MGSKGHVGLIWLSLALSFVIIGKDNSFSFSFGGGQQAVNLQTVVVSDFGNENDQSNNIKWNARFSKFAIPTDLNAESSPPSPKFCGVTYLEAKPLGLPALVDARQKWSLGVKAAYTRKGYNWIEVFPVKGGGATEAPKAAVAAPTNQTNAGAASTVVSQPEGTTQTVISPLDLPGQVRSMDMWVWGGNYHYWMEFYILDYKGYLNRISAGDIDFVGWKNLMVKIPDYIPQAERHVPFLKSLSLQMIKLWSYPTERVDQFYCYFNYLQVQTDVYVERFNGDDLANKRW
jgi:hypothetical protein